MAGSDYPDWAYEHDANDNLILNFYGQPIVSAGHFMEEHRAALVPAAAGLPPVCACGWTRWRTDGGYWFELCEHLQDMNPVRSDTETIQA